MNIERPFNQYLEMSRANNRANWDLLKYVFEKSDNISLWIISIAIGAISIFANNIADVQSVISLYYLKPILLMLTTSVTSGIIYRGLYLYLFVLMDANHRGIDMAFSNQKMMDFESTLNGSESFSELISTLKSGFGEDLSYLIAIYENVDEKIQKELYESVVNHYLRRVEFAIMDANTAKDFISETYSNFFGGKKEKLRELLDDTSTGKRFNLVLIVTKIFYLIYILAFISALFTFVAAV